MALGPIFARELSTAPRRPRLYIHRTVYVLALFVLMATGWLVLAGTQPIRNVGDLSRYGRAMFFVLAPLQLAVLTFLGALGSAAAVSQEKDRRTLILLLLTRMGNGELVLGKLGASLLSVFSMLLAGLPVLVLVTVFGGVSLGQVAAAYGMTAATIVAAGAVGCTIAFWREKTFQALAMTVMVVVLWVAAWEAVAGGGLGGDPGVVAELGRRLSPVRAMESVLFPPPADVPWWRDPAWQYAGAMVVVAMLVMALAAARVRVWNPSREVRRKGDEAEEEAWGVAEGAGEAGASDWVEAAREQHVDARLAETRVRHRRVWDQPILWREVCTWAYGRKIILVRLAYAVLAALTVAGLWAISAEASRDDGPATLWVMIPPAARLLGPFLLISLVMINALAVTSITGERDGQALDLLLATDILPKEFVLGKLFGVLWVTKEMVLAPILIVGWLWWRGEITLENTLFVEGVLLVLVVFSAMLGIHYGMHYASSRTAVLVSLGTVFFLFLGIVTCLVIMVSFQGSFQQQLAPFLAFIGGGSLGLFAALGVRNPSSAIAMASMLLPFATFFAITAFLVGRQELSVFAVVTGAYGFAVAALLVPALSAFDLAMGRTKGAEEEA